MAKQNLKIGSWPHWFQPEYKIARRLADELHCDVTEINFRKKGYLEPLDVMIIEQNGFDDYLENDALYIQDFVRRGGICWIMHQDAARWTTHFLPEELGEPFLISRYVETISPEHRSYLMPEITPAGQSLFRTPNAISPEEMVYWKLPCNSFRINAMNSAPEQIESTALSAVLNSPKWETLGHFRDAAVPDGALILQAKYGDGLFFWNQILFPEQKQESCRREFAFWDRYAENVLHHFEMFRQGKKENIVPEKAHRRLPEKGCYKMLAHLHSLDWFGADTPPWTIAAAMKHHGFDIGILSVKDALSCGEPDRYSDDRVLLLSGQEFHPFNWEERQSSHNSFHILAMGTNDFSTEFTTSFYDTDEIDAYLRKAIEFVHRNGGVAAATHPDSGYWKNYGFDAVDVALEKTLCGSDIEKFYLDGRRITMIASVDMWGIRRLSEYPVFNFLYQQGVPDHDSVVSAIRSGHLIPALNMNSAELTLDGTLPGDTLSSQQARRGTLRLAAECKNRLKELRIYSREKAIYTETLNSVTVKREIPLDGCELKSFLRVEIEGENAMLISNPFYLTE